jgi:hypothetical protein
VSLSVYFYIIFLLYIYIYIILEMLNQVLTSTQELLSVAIPNLQYVLVLRNEDMVKSVRRPCAHM